MNELRWSEVRGVCASPVVPDCPGAIATPLCSATYDFPHVTSLAAAAHRSSSARSQLGRVRGTLPGAFLADPFDPLTAGEPAGHQEQHNDRQAVDDELAGLAVEPGHGQNEDQERHRDVVRVRRPGHPELRAWQ